MLSLKDKKILVVGDPEGQMQTLSEQLTNQGATVEFISAENVTPGHINDNDIDLIIQTETMNQEMVNIIQGTELQRVVPVLAQTEDNPEQIQEVLLSGVADYITKSESTDSILQKIEAIFSEHTAFGSSSAIDLTHEDTSSAVAGIKVFAVEDDPLLRNLISIRLDKSSFPYTFNKDGKEVKKQVKEFQPDAIILDLMLPGISGFDILEEIKADDDIKDIPVIVFSNKDGEEDRKKAKELGAVSFYVKAMTDLSELIEQIESAVNNK